MGPQYSTARPLASLRRVLVLLCSSLEIQGERKSGPVLENVQQRVDAINQLQQRAEADEEAELAQREAERKAAAR